MTLGFQTAFNDLPESNYLILNRGQDEGRLPTQLGRTGQGIGRLPPQLGSTGQVVGRLSTQPGSTGQGIERLPP